MLLGFVCGLVGCVLCFLFDAVCRSWVLVAFGLLLWPLVGACFGLCLGVCIFGCFFFVCGLCISAWGCFVSCLYWLCAPQIVVLRCWSMCSGLYGVLVVRGFLLCFFSWVCACIVFICFFVALFFVFYACRSVWFLFGLFGILGGVWVFELDFWVILVRLGLILAFGLFNVVC